jgi:hypothetical protein
MVQGLSHPIAQVQMEPLSTSMTTRSYELLMQGVDMVRYDSPEVFDAIERMNPFVPRVRRTYFDLAVALHDMSAMVMAQARARSIANLACFASTYSPGVAALKKPKNSRSPP